MAALAPLLCAWTRRRCYTSRMPVTRREFLAASALPAAFWPFATAGPARAGQASGPSVDAAALRARLEGLSVFGRPPGGTFADGVSRVAYSDADRAGRRYVMDLMRGAGLAPSIDPAGNIVARRAGTEPSLAPILVGSHIDSVPSGGNFDGDLGVLAALGGIEALDRAGVRTRHPIEIAVWSAEEGVAFGRGLAGSRIVAGDIAPADLDAVWNGMTRRDAIASVGGRPDSIMDAVRPKGAHHVYLELHIEQGGTLERDDVTIGVVEGIVAIHRYTAVISGFANHAGTTPMAERQDAMIAASQLTLAVREAVTARPGRQVGTVGHLQVEPNAPNVVPGRVRLTIELRDLSPDRLLEIAKDIRQRAAAIATATRTTIDITDLGRNPPALASDEVQRAIELAADARRLSARRQPSGAGHDAQMMAQLAPMGMIFVPSIGGISHSPKELTSWEDCARGANVLLGAILEVDREYGSGGSHLPESPDP
jgi:beta-ureidopropionase / N-carbamoyl-L-amino-acid hydrolase